MRKLLWRYLPLAMVGAAAGAITAIIVNILGG
jgi:hypothetical protein